MFFKFVYCYNKVNEMSFYSVNVLLSIDLIFLLKVSPLKCRFLALKSSPIASDVLYDLCLLSRWILTCIFKQAQLKHIFVHPTVTKLAASRSAMFTYRFFSALKGKV